jgi:aminoglycoside/choline kinase family phosphotransferase
MIDREQVIRTFLETCGWDQARRQAMTADASFRSYERLYGPGDNTAILMNAPPETNEPVDIFAAIAEILLEYGYSAPRILAPDYANGLLLIEDLGDDLFARICWSHAQLEAPLYESAVDLLIDLSGQPQPATLPPYSDAVYRREASLLPDWYLRAATGGVNTGRAAEFLDLVSTACAAVAPFEPVLVMRDYHAENLLWLPDRRGVARVGLLDFQDALLGHPAYDLVSLLEDARRDTSPSLQSDMKQRYIAATPLDPADFEYAYCAIGAQRNLKIIGIFARLFLRDGKAGYLDLIPRVWGHLQRDVAHPRLQDLRRWIDANVPEPTSETLNAIHGYSDAS